MTTAQVVWSGVMFGLGVAVPFGPINVEIARRALLRGWGAGVALGVGACTVDMVYACVAGVGASRVVKVMETGWVSGGLTLLSVVFLGWLGVGSLRGALKAYREGVPVLGAGAEKMPVPGAEVDNGAGPSVVRGYLTGFGMTAVNPMTLVFWFVGLPGLVVALGLGAGQVKWWVGGVFCGALSWVLVFSGIMAGLGRWRRPWWMVVADVVGGLVLLGYAGAAAVRGGRGAGWW